MVLKQLFKTFRARIFLSFLGALLPILVLLSLTVELFYVPSLTANAKAELTNSTRALTKAIQASASVAIRNHLKAIAERNREIVRQHLSLVDQGVLSPKEALSRIRAILLSQRVGSSGYIYCLNSQGLVTVHPNAQVQDSDVTAYGFVQDQIARKEGYVEYDWQNPGEPAPRPKALYMVYLEELDWIISVSSYRAEFNELLDPRDLRDMVLSQRFGDSGYAYVVNTDGDVLIHPKLSNFNIFKQQEEPSEFLQTMLDTGSGSLEYLWRNPGERDQRRKIAVYESIPEYGWMVASSAYLDEVMEPARLARTVAHGSTALLLLTGCLVSYILSGRLTRPIAQMLVRLDRNAREASYEHLPLPTDAELNRLAGEFNAFIDMTRRQNSEIRAEHERYRNLFEASPDAVFLMLGVSIIDCNTSAETLLNVDKASIIGKTVVDFSPATQPDGQPSASAAKTLIRLSTVQSLQTFEWVNRTADGRLFDSEVRLKRLEDADADLLLAFVRDITDRKQAEDALRESELKYRQLIEKAHDPILIAQGERIAFANAKASEMSGYGHRELTTAPFEKFIHPDDFPMVADRHLRRLAGETGIPSTYLFRLMTKQGAERTIQISVVLIDWNGKPATLNFLRDITDQKRMEESLYQAQKMEAIGTLAGGIAHDFNNLMLGIQGRASLMTLQLPSGHPLQEHIQAIDKYVRSASSLTNQLLGVAQGGKYEPTPIDVKELIDGSSAMFGRTKKEIQVTTNAPVEPVIIEADRQQIEQVLLNLYVNAWQAMPGGGALTVEAGLAEVDRKTARQHHARQGRYAMISVTDSGTGMDDATLSQAFDPFFTTKEKSRGTGLGLASAYGIIKNHDGFIAVRSKVGRGSTFTLYLPASNKRVQRQRLAAHQVLKGEGTILLVDDEPMVVDVGKAMLESIGYGVVVATGCEEALEALSQADGAIELVILDMIMPGIDGSETYDRIRRLRPDLPVILSSGYSLDGKATEIMQRGCNGFIQKPFSLSELSQKIREVFNAVKAADQPVQP